MMNNLAARQHLATNKRLPKWQRLVYEPLEARLVLACFPSCDYGDAPAPYPTLLVDDGPEHVASGPTLGSSRDANETDGQPSTNADGDDANNVDDENGVTFGTIRVGQTGASVTVNVQGAPTGAKLDAWIDFNGDGSWGGAHDRIATAMPVVNNNNTITFDVPAWAKSGITFARFRLSTAGGLPVTGEAADGEVEDHAITISPAKVADGVFTSHEIELTGFSPAENVIAVDLDGDGDLDVVNALYFDDELTWHENRLDEPEEDFGPAQTITSTAGGVYSIFTADLDGDGDQDILSAAYADNKISWYENRLNQIGLEDFRSQQIISSTAGNAKSIFAADIDGDGDIDVISSAYTDDKIVWYENRLNEAAGFSAENIISSTAYSALSLFAVDLDGDGDIDVLSASPTSGVMWYENLNSAGNFGAQQAIPSSLLDPYSIFAVDLDSDGDIDVVSGSYSGDHIVWHENRLNEAENGFIAPQLISTDAPGTLNVRAADIDGDGDLDILSASYSSFTGESSIAWYENRLSESEGDFGAQQVVSENVSASRSLFAADIDGDGDIDLLSASDYDYKFVWHENQSATLFADLNDDKIVDKADLKIILENYGKTTGVGYEQGDLDDDGKVGLNDLLLMKQNHGNTLLEPSELFADLNNDKVVNQADLRIILEHYGKATGASYEQGDLDDDGKVGLNDLLLMKQNFGKTVSSPVPAPVAQAAASFVEKLVGGSTVQLQVVDRAIVDLQFSSQQRDDRLEMNRFNHRMLFKQSKMKDVAIRDAVEHPAVNRVRVRGSMSLRSARAQLAVRVDQPGTIE